MELLEQLERIAGRLRALQEKHKVLSAENEQLTARIQTLEADLSSKESEIIMLKDQNKMTKLAKGLSADEDQSELKAQLDELITEIDHCIKLIKR